ncbi:MoaD/ThiS family protein [Cognatazoarcus halotolerans]|uniref:MoaD/ThiS family protein n=1 Tax=Cognatazoarcus halotolerans TaxID=2686016 RepID=UPI00135CF754|nr:MoaD/ThiS family protein [Cognatazoarcus halotolerans]MCB1900122.1 MoaD/ThiS family protein [Rhodocyclaceae bacterium]MCP5311305.1 MoaD/ThiS family protein [Zoogloeaceae bacterium]
MKIRFKLFAGLTELLPPTRKSNVVELEVEDGTSVQQMIDLYRIPPRNAHLVLLNGLYIAPAERPASRLSEGDELAIWPPVAGG